jgi:hypothetical protein
MIFILTIDVFRSKIKDQKKNTRNNSARKYRKTENKINKFHQLHYFFSIYIFY